MKNDISDTNDYLDRLRESEPLQESVVRSAIRALQLPMGSRGLDVGCGYGAQVLQLAAAVGPTGHVTGVDISREFLEYGAEVVAGSDLAERVSLREGDMNDLPFEEDTFDWAWSMSCIGYFPGDPMPALKEVMRVVKPGSSIALVIWSSEQLLTGYPRLEARLKATTAGIAPFVQGNKPETHFLRTLGRFHELALEESTVHTFVEDFQAPLTDDIRRALIGLFEMRWPGVESELSDEDWADFRRFTRPDSPDFVLDLPNYYAFFTCSVFTGKVRH